MSLNARITLISDFHILYRRRGLTEEVIKTFQEYIYSFYRRRKRRFPFRENITPYRVLVSEIMLQQTQTNRVADKFLEFMDKYPDINSLAHAKVKELLSIWQGLGYNRRALALKKIAVKLVNEFDGKVPKDKKTLESLPQIGHNTASSILSFAYNIPTYFVETNIRRVYIYFFFPGRTNVSDKEIMEIIKVSVDEQNPRDWYYALMDYGVMLKKTHPELNKRSSKYRKQTKFKGSTREIRGKVLKLLLNKPFTVEDLVKRINGDKKKILEILEKLMKEGFLQKDNELFHIKK